MVRRASLFLIALSLVLATGKARADGEKPDCFVVSAGIDIYASPKVNDLKGCVTDARTATRVFRQQQGTLFSKVVSHTLTDATATSSRIKHEFAKLRKAGKAGDYAVIFLSGHGGRDNPGWHFCPSDYDPANPRGTSIDASTLMGAADVLAARGLKVVVIVDACYCGNLRLLGKAQLDHHRDQNGGGILLMLSSSPNQVSQALGQYSAYAEAVAEALAGKADLNRDGKVTIAEARTYASRRVHEMLKQHSIQARQDGDVAHSPSFSDNFGLAMPRSGIAPIKLAAARTNSAR
jgi:hypothetical protein